MSNSAGTLVPGSAVASSSVANGVAVHLLGEGLAERILFVLLLLLLLWLPLPWGSNRPWAEALFGLVVGTLGALYLLVQMLRRRAGGFSPVPYLIPVLLWVAWLVWTAMQLMPIDPGLLRQFSPVTARFYVSAFPGATGQAWPVSVLPEKTLERLFLSGGYFSLYVLVLGLARDRMRLKTLGNVLVISALFQAANGGIMVVTGVEYGFFAHKTAYLGLATGTFVNRNHLAGYLELGAAVAIGLILADLRAVNVRNWRQRLAQFLSFLSSARLRVRVFLAVIVVGLVLTRSRGGGIAFFSALVVCLPAYIFLKERRLFLKSMLLFVSLVAVDVWIVSGWFGLDKLVNRFEQTHEETEARAYAFAAYPGLIEKYWRTGSGSGTFAAVFAQNQPWNAYGYYDHAHNDYAEFLIESGVPGLLILMVLVGVTNLHAVRVILRRDDRLRVGMCYAYIMASAELAVHSFTDFNLQIPANAATYVTLMAMVGACAQQGHRRKQREVMEDAGKAPELAADRL